MTVSSLIAHDGTPVVGTPLGALLTAQAQVGPDRPALTAGGRTLSRAELDAAANRRARWLTSHGVNAGDVVMIALPNGTAWYETALAAWKLGATPAHVSHRLVAAELEAVEALCQPCIVVSELPGARHVPPTALGTDIDASPHPPHIAPRWRIATSGGSTGRPKLIVDPGPSVWTADKAARRRPPGVTLINPAPLYHSAPFALMLTALLEGSHVIDMERFDAEMYMRLVAAHRADWAYLVPTMMARIARLPADVRARHDITSLRTVLHMAAPCAPWIKRVWIDWLGPDAIWEVYGGTERLGVTLIGGRDWLEHPGSVGRSPDGRDIAIMDTQGRHLPPNDIGEIYFRQPAAPAFEYIGADPRMRGDFASFGDFGWLDEDGFLFIADRRDDMVLSGGVNFYPAEIEMALEACPGVIASAVFGLPDADLGQALHATIQHAPDDPAPPDAAQLEAWLKGRLGRPKWPRSYDFVTTPIRDEAGKLRRSAWRERLLRNPASSQA